MVSINDAETVYKLNTVNYTVADGDYLKIGGTPGSGRDMIYSFDNGATWTSIEITKNRFELPLTAGLVNPKIIIGFEYDYSNAPHVRFGKDIGEYDLEITRIAYGSDISPMTKDLSVRNFKFVTGFKYLGTYKETFRNFRCTGTFDMNGQEEIPYYKSKELMFYGAYIPNGDIVIKSSSGRHNYNWSSIFSRALVKSVKIQPSYNNDSHSMFFNARITEDLEFINTEGALPVNGKYTFYALRCKRIINPLRRFFDPKNTFSNMAIEDNPYRFGKVELEFRKTGIYNYVFNSTYIKNLGDIDIIIRDSVNGLDIGQMFSTYIQTIGNVKIISDVKIPFTLFDNYPLRLLKRVSSIDATYLDVNGADTIKKNVTKAEAKNIIPKLGEDMYIQLASKFYYKAEEALDPKLDRTPPARYSRFGAGCNPVDVVFGLKEQVTSVKSLASKENGMSILLVGAINPNDWDDSVLIVNDTVHKILSMNSKSIKIYYDKTASSTNTVYQDKTIKVGDDIYLYRKRHAFKIKDQPVARIEASYNVASYGYKEIIYNAEQEYKINLGLVRLTDPNAINALMMSDSIAVIQKSPEHKDYLPEDRELFSKYNFLKDRDTIDPVIVKCNLDKRNIKIRQGIAKIKLLVDIVE